MRNLVCLMLLAQLAAGCSDSSRRHTRATAASASSAATTSTSTTAPVVHPLEGVYDVVGTDSALGPYTGQVELRDQGTHLDFVRVVQYQNSAPNGLALATAWTGVAVTRPGGLLHVTVSLNRIDWVTEAGGLVRTAADQVPDTVLGTYRPDASGGLAGTLDVQQGGTTSSEVLTWTAPPGSAPLFAEDRTRVPMHRPMPGWMKSIVFAIFASYHALPELQPYVHRQDFQDAVHLEVVDKTGFDWLRANPGTMLVPNKPVDAISLKEAQLRQNSFGLRLHEKAARFDQDMTSGRHLDEGMVVWAIRPDPSAPGGFQRIEDMSTFEYSATYLFAQRCRFLVTGDPQALANVEAMIEVFCDMIEIDPRPGEFARSLRPVNRAPNVGSWHAGQGRFAHLAWHDNGNNDMVKGFWMAFFAAWEVLPQNHPLRPRIVACVREMADHWIISNPGAVGGSGHPRDRPNNRLMNGMLAFWITGDPRYEQEYRDALRDPLLLLEMAAGGSVAMYGIGDSGGFELGLATDVIRIELGRKLSSPWTGLFEHSLRMNHTWLRRYRHTPTSVAAAAYLGATAAGAVDESLWQMREFPYPKPSGIGIDRSLDPTFSLSPIPEVPWKLDWMQGNGWRNQGLYTYPVFMRGGNNFYFRDHSFGFNHPYSDLEWPGDDYLFVYWMARLYNVVSPTE